MRLRGARRAGRRAAFESWRATRTARALPLTTLAETVWIAAGRPRRRPRRRPMPMTVTAGAVGVAGAGAATAYIMSRRSRSQDGQAEHAEQVEQAVPAGTPPQTAESRDKPPRVHTTPQEGHPAGTGERSARDIGGPTSPESPPEGDVSGGAPGTPPGSGFEPHR